ncbi:MAG: hypothetical protein RL194_384 [Pseudomonadota bacterium]|jgi:predicted chitinase
MSDRAEAIVDIIDECDKQGLTLDTQKAYVLATVEHETGNTFKPVREAFFLKNPLRYLKSLRYYPYYGRGYVQLTWKENYRKYGDILGVDLVGNPDLACRPDVARYVLVHGFRTGAFTGKRLTDYVTAGKTDFINARRCINGTDKAARIAQLASKWLRVLREA